MKRKRWIARKEKEKLLIVNKNTDIERLKGSCGRGPKKKKKTIYIEKLGQKKSD